ncbi:MAG: RagB/SusD family nutrient uptake outer membrane protein, partial [Bacteroidales bacterium]
QISAESLYQERATAQETMNFIKEDLKISEQNFGTNVTMGTGKATWSKYATLMLKAEVYLWTAKVSTADLQANPADANIAKDALNEVYGRFELMDSFTSVFSEKGNKEVIFALRFDDGEATNFASSFTYSNNVFLGQVYGRDNKLIESDTLLLKNSGILRNEYKWGLFASMNEKDTRRDASFLDYYDSEGAPKGLAFKKCIGILNNEGNRVYQNDINVYRYADVLLMLAEIENMNGGDISTYMNQVRERAYGANWDETQFGYVNGTKDQNELAILFERDKEFIWEGKRWFDVVRMKNGAGESLVFDARVNYDDETPILTKDQSHMILWPIDINTLNNDPKLVNNPGY